MRGSKALLKSLEACVCRAGISQRAVWWVPMPAVLLKGNLYSSAFQVVVGAEGVRKGERVQQRLWVKAQPALGIFYPVVVQPLGRVQLFATP